MQFNIKQKYLLESLRMLSGVVEKNDSSNSDHKSNVLVNLSKKYLMST